MSVEGRRRGEEERGRRGRKRDEGEQWMVGVTAVDSALIGCLATEFFV